MPRCFFYPAVRCCMEGIVFFSLLRDILRRILKWILYVSTDLWEGVSLPGLSLYILTVSLKIILNMR